MFLPAAPVILLIALISCAYAESAATEGLSRGRQPRLLLGGGGLPRVHPIRRLPVRCGARGRDGGDAPGTRPAGSPPHECRDGTPHARRRHPGAPRCRRGGG